MDTKDRYRGSLIGLAVGDALGAAIEFKPPGTFEPVVDMRGGGPWNLKPGYWTDDTSMALCLAESLSVQKMFEPADQLRRYLKWYRTGYLSSIGKCFDIGPTTKKALERFEKNRNLSYCGSVDSHASNGSLMRLAPVPLAYANDPERAVDLAGRSSKTTHGAVEAVDSCRYLAALIVGAVNGKSKRKLLAGRYEPVSGIWQKYHLAPEVDKVANGSFMVNKTKVLLRESKNGVPLIQGSGEAVRCLEAALWAFHSSDSFDEGCLLAVNLGDDADTTAAVYGQLAGAYYGEGAIPASWCSKLFKKELIASYADNLYSMSLDYCR